MIEHDIESQTNSLAEHDMLPTTSSEANDESNDTTQLVEGDQINHVPLPIISALYCQLLLLIGLVAGGFLIPVFYNNEMEHTTDSFSVINYFHIIIWAFIMALTWCVKAEHKKSRILGYHDFYNSTRYLHRVAFYFTCGGNAMLLIIGSLTHNYCIGGGLSPCSQELLLSPVNYQQIIFVIEMASSLPLIIKHIVEVFRFNRDKSSPDVLREDGTHSMQQEEGKVGMSRGPSLVDRVLERQADQLLTCKHRNKILCQQIFTLTQELQTLQTSDLSVNT